jgi:AcrR family transcriptional regulator
MSRGNTRQRIQDVALELFSEHGYEKTSLREIAEHLGVTKAALYYHFRTKEDLVASIVEDLNRPVEELIEWAESRPRTLETKKEVLRRYSLALTNALPLFRFLQENQAAIRDLKLGQNMKDRMVHLSSLLKEPGAPMVDQVRAVSALFTMHAGMFAWDQVEGDPEDKRRAVLQVAEEMISAAQGERPDRPGRAPGPRRSTRQVARHAPHHGDAEHHRVAPRAQFGPVTPPAQPLQQPAAARVHRERQAQNQQDRVVVEGGGELPVQHVVRHPGAAADRAQQPGRPPEGAARQQVAALVRVRVPQVRGAGQPGGQCDQRCRCRVDGRAAGRRDGPRPAGGPEHRRTPLCAEPDHPAIPTGSGAGRSQPWPCAGGRPRVVAPPSRRQRPSHACHMAPGDPWSPQYVSPRPPQRPSCGSCSAGGRRPPTRS